LILGLLLQAKGLPAMVALFFWKKESVNEIPEQPLNDTPLIEVVMSD
jgi:Flp pilus assembly protein CpaB